MKGFEVSCEFVGRRSTLAEIERCLSAARAGTPQLAVVEGSTGSGKTTLLQQLADTHARWTVWRARGTKWESARDFGVLEQLLRTPIAIDAAGTIATTVLEHVARRTPADSTVLILVDDGHWTDICSMKALVSALNRTDQPVCMVVAVNSQMLYGTANDLVELLSQHSHNTVTLGPLAPSEIQELAATLVGVTPPLPVARRLSEHVGGSTRYLVQTLHEVPPPTWAHWLPELPVPTAATAVFLSKLAACDLATRALVEAAAILGTQCSLAHAAALAEVTHPVEALDEAFRYDLLAVTESPGSTEIRFTSPLARASIYSSLGPVRARRLHLRASRIVGTESQALNHRAAASLFPDDDLAAELEDFASAKAEGGAWAAAAEVLIKASRLSSSPTDRQSRLLQAVDALIGAGDVLHARLFAAEIESFPASPLRDATLGYLAIMLGRQAEASQMLNQAWEACDPDLEPNTAALISQRRVLDSLFRWHGKDVVAWAEQTAALAKESNPAVIESEAIVGLGLAAIGLTAEARASYEGSAADRLLGAQPQRFRMGKGWLDLALDEPESARQELERAFPTMYHAGSHRISISGQSWLARAQFILGEWDDALGTVNNAASLVDEMGLELLRPLVHWTGAQIHALRGDEPAARAHLRLAHADVYDYEMMFIPACLARAQIAEAKADYDAVVRALRPIAELTPRQGIDEPGFWPWVDMLANGLVMSGHLEEADQFLIPHEQVAWERKHRSSMARLGYVRGRILAAHGDIDSARNSFEASLGYIDRLSMPYDRARINLAYGQTLRRARKRKEADVVLSAARDGYAMLGATPYIERCDRELKAGGVNARRVANPNSELTPQEKAVVRLIARGASNKDAAEELFVSIKTIQYHLTRIYTKVGVRSRTELVAMLLEPK
jgi:DNA-binding CsgD family transcriptional regulator